MAPAVRCYCDQSPRDAATGQRRFMCNVCVNAIIDEKYRLVKENYQLTFYKDLVKIGGARCGPM